MFKIRSFMLFAIVAIALTACSQSQADSTSAVTEGYNFRPVEDIIDAELEVANFANDGTVTLPTNKHSLILVTSIRKERDEENPPEFRAITINADRLGRHSTARASGIVAQAV